MNPAFIKVDKPEQLFLWERSPGLRRGLPTIAPEDGAPTGIE